MVLITVQLGVGTTRPDSNQGSDYITVFLSLMFGLKFKIHNQWINISIQVKI